MFKEGKITDSDGNNSTVQIPSGYIDTNYSFKDYYIISKLVIIDLIPYIMIIVLNCCIIKALFKSSQKVSASMVSKVQLPIHKSTDF